jgi:hypothetical protein
MSMDTLTKPAGRPAARMPMTAARRLTLAVGVPFLAVVIGWTALSIVADAGTGTYQFSRDLPVTGGTLHASLGDGSVTLEPGPTARLTGIITYSLIRPHLAIHGSSVDYHCPVPTGQCSLNSTLTVPPGDNVSLSSGLGDLTVNGATSGNISLSTSSGDLTANGLTGTSDTLTTTAGNITATGITAPDVTASAVAGDVTLTFTRAPGNLTVRSTFGDISIVLPPVTDGYNIQTSSHFGDSSVSSGVDQNNSSTHVIKVTSTAGDISISGS